MDKTIRTICIIVAFCLGWTLYDKVIDYIKYIFPLFFTKKIYFQEHLDTWSWYSRISVTSWKAGCPEFQTSWRAGCPEFQTSWRAGWPEFQTSWKAGCPEFQTSWRAGCPEFQTSWTFDISFLDFLRI